MQEYLRGGLGLSATPKARIPDAQLVSGKFDDLHLALSLRAKLHGRPTHMFAL